VNERDLRRMTLWQLVQESDRICRELLEHYRRDYLPRLAELQRTVQPRNEPDFDVADTVVVNAIRRVCASEQYAVERLQQLEMLLKEIVRRSGARR